MLPLLIYHYWCGCLSSIQSCSVVSTSFGEDTKTAKTYFVVGTAVTNPLENEPQEGRILMFEVVEGKLQLVCSKGMCVVKVCSAFESFTH